MLLGAHLSDPKRPADQNVSTFEPRLKAGVLLAAPGNGGESLSKFARENYSELNPDYSFLKTRALSVVGDEDDNKHLSVRGPDWYNDPYRDSPGIEYRLTLRGAKHGLGGIAGYDAKETSDESPELLAVTQRMTWAYLKSVFEPDNNAWQEAIDSLNGPAKALAFVDSKN
jgi:hypothetical protein